MKVFISWSGHRSLEVAKALHGFLVETFQSAKPWMSANDISAGTRWNSEINTQLSQTSFGVICLTRENQHAPWVQFEAGALAKTLEGSYVVPYLIDLEAADVEGPLSQFQAQRSNKEGTLGILKSMNKAMNKVQPENVLPEDVLERVFDRNWPYLEEAFGNIAVSEVPKQELRKPDDVTREVLDLVRSLSRRFDDFATRRELLSLDRVRHNARGNRTFDRRLYEGIEGEAIALEEAAQEKAELEGRENRTIDDEARIADIDSFLEDQL